VTFDGLHYDFQAVGDFVAVQSTASGNPWEIQIRTASFPGATSITTPFAPELGRTRVTFAVRRADMVYIAGAVDPRLHSGVAQRRAGGGSLTQLAEAVYQLSWRTGEVFTVTHQDGFLDWTVGLGAQDGPGSVRGLLGSNSGRDSDFQLPDGTVLRNPSDGDILGVFAEAWRVTPGNSLLDEPPHAAMLVQS